MDSSDKCFYWKQPQASILNEGSSLKISFVSNNTIKLCENGNYIQRNPALNGKMSSSQPKAYSAITIDGRPT